jgi:hypothetical protein
MKQKLAQLTALIKPVSFDKSDFAGAVLRSELRTALRAMTLTEKAAALLGEKAIPDFIDAALEGPALLSGIDPAMFETVREQRLESLYARESFEIEALSDQIAEAESGLQVAKDDIKRAAALPEHEFAKISTEVAEKRNAVWLKRFKRDDGSEYLVVVPLQGGGARPATSDDIRDGKEYASYGEYQADRAA